jgi:murein DD-endopeptidase MepM/ murein hydrolase activator NlpD
VSTLKRYKELEKTVYRKGSAMVSSAGKGFASRMKEAWASGRQKFTIMLVPHSEKRVFNLQISKFALAGIALTLIALLGGILIFGARFGTTERQLTAKTESLKDAQSSLDSMRDETSSLLKAAKKFEVSLSETLGIVGVDSQTKSATKGQSGDLSSFFDVRERDSGVLREVSEVQKVTDYLEQTSDQVKQLGLLYGSKYKLNDVPTIWPIKSGRGEISMYFGQNRNPFTRLWYIHQGVDIITCGCGDPISATADGEVIQVAYEAGYGNYITIKHQFGFYTRYAHLQSARVNKGDKVQQGQVIGYLGNTGQTTGPHLHYEIRLGTSIVDPLKYLNRPKPQAIAPAGNL